LRSPGAERHLVVHAAQIDGPVDSDHLPALALRLGDTGMTGLYELILFGFRLSFNACGAVLGVIHAADAIRAILTADSHSDLVERAPPRNSVCSMPRTFIPWLRASATQANRARPASSRPLSGVGAGVVAVGLTMQPVRAVARSSAVAIR